MLPRPIDVLANDTDPNGDELSIVSSTDPAHGGVTCTADLCTYTSEARYRGPDSFDYTISDPSGGTDTATVSVTVIGNTAPVGNNDTAATDEDTSALIPVTANDTDAEGDTLTAEVRTQPTHGSVTCSAGSCTYVPAANYNGPDSFTYTASDGDLSSAPTTVNVTVRPVNDAPVAVDDSATTEEDTAKTVAVTANDTDVEGSALTASLVGAPSHGTATCSAGVVYLHACGELQRPGLLHLSGQRRVGELGAGDGVDDGDAGQRCAGGGRRLGHDGGGHGQDGGGDGQRHRRRGQCV